MTFFLKTMASDDAGTETIDKLKGLNRIDYNQSKANRMQAVVDVAFQTAVAANDFNKSFYDLSLKLVAMGSDDRVKDPANMVSTIFTKALGDVRQRHGFDSHDDMVKQLASLAHPLKVFRVYVIDKGCRHLLAAYHHLDTFVISVTKARDSTKISDEQAASLVEEARALFRSLKKGLKTPKPAVTRRA